MSKLVNFLFNKVIPSLSQWQWWGLAMATVIVSQYTMNWLNGLYLESQFPVSIYEGQTTFDGEIIKGYYATLFDLGTFERYVWVQIFDFVFMATVLISMFCLMAAIYSSLSEVSPLKKIGKLMIVIAPMAALSDALENFVSFFMLVEPMNFANWLAIPYSSLAAIKFFIFSVSYLWVAIALVDISSTFIVQKMKKQNA